MLGSLGRGIYPFDVNFIKRKILRSLFEAKITIYIVFLCAKISLIWPAKSLSMLYHTLIRDMMRQESEKL